MKTSTRLRELRIQGFKSIADQTIKLQPLTLFIGANGSGKSNLVSFLSMAGVMQARNLQEWVGKQGGANDILHFGSKKTQKLAGRIAFEKDNGSAYYSFQMTASASDHLLFTGEEIGIQAKNAHSFRQFPLESTGSKESALADPLNATNGFLVQEGPSPEELEAVQAIAHLLRGCQAYQFHDTSVHAGIRLPCAIDDNRIFQRHGENLPAWLYRLQAKHIDSYEFIQDSIAQVFPDFGGFELSPDPLSEKKIALRWRHKSEEGTFGAHQLSDGTLRFMALCALLLQPVDLMPDMVLIDEPELGLHPAALVLLASMVQRVVDLGKQVLLTTQSSGFLSHFEPEQVVVVDRKDGASEFRPVSKMGLDLKTWLEEYESLGALWETNLLGGRP